MSDVLDDLGSDDGDLDIDEDPSRRRSLWWLLGLFGLAALAAIFMIVFSQSKHSSPGALVPTGPVLIPPSQSSSPAGQAPPAQSSPAANVSASAPNPGADGGVVAAVNALRASHALPPVTGAVSPAAVQCAQAKGSGPSCVPHYVYAVVPTEDGAKAVADIVGFSPKWLLDPATTRIAVGWSPQGSEFALALLKWP